MTTGSVYKRPDGTYETFHEDIFDVDGAAGKTTSKNIREEVFFFDPDDPDNAYFGYVYMPEGQPDEPISSEQVKAEAGRRILEVCPELKQRNMTARAAELAIKGVSNWTAEEQAEAAAGQILWDQIRAIRAASNVLEARNPIPQDFVDDSHWPTPRICR